MISNTRAETLITKFMLNPNENKDFLADAKRIYEKNGINHAHYNFGAMKKNLAAHNIRFRSVPIQRPYNGSPYAARKVYYPGGTKMTMFFDRNPSEIEFM